jgi:HEPN domain-containing protein
MDEKEKAAKRFEEWEKYALEDEQIIVLALKEGGPPNQICLHAQQMAEKYLKGYLAFNKNIPLKTHQM